MLKIRNTDYDQAVLYLSVDVIPLVLWLLLLFIMSMNLLITSIKISIISHNTSL